LSQLLVQWLPENAIAAMVAATIAVKVAAGVHV